MLYLGRERHLLSNSAVVKAHATMFRIGGRESKITKVRLEPFTKISSFYFPKESCQNVVKAEKNYLKTTELKETVN